MVSSSTNSSPVVVNSSTIVKARVLNGTWSALTEGNFTVALLGIPIRITELELQEIGWRQSIRRWEIERLRAAVRPQIKFRLAGSFFLRIDAVDFRADFRTLD